MIHKLKRYYNRLICRLFGHKFCEHSCCHRCGYISNLIYKSLELQFAMEQNRQIAEMNEQIWGECDDRSSQVSPTSNL